MTERSDRKAYEDLIAHFSTRAQEFEEEVVNLSEELVLAKVTIQRVQEVCEDKYVGPPTEYGEGFQNGYNDALNQVLRALDGE